ncbi:MAG TPA: hypothetical protein VNF07_11415 [Acidimicrobiales bacterium]|nr:hypothetical protein [Acidimicrobiales bacterium]
MVQRRTTALTALASLAALAGALLVAPRGAGAAPLFPLPVTAVQPEPCPPPYHPPGPPPPPLAAPAVAEAAIPLAAAPARRHVNLAAISGKGIWVTPFPGAPANVAAVVAAARAAGLQQIWIRTGSTHDGYYGAPTLARLLPAAHALGIDVIAWDFPTLSNPAADAARAAATLASGIDGFSADIEEHPEGTYDTARRVTDYLSLVRRAAGHRPVVATVPRPLSVSLTGFPYAAAAPYVDAFAPMIYWSCNEPGVVTELALRALNRLGRVAPIGQDYNMADEGGRVGLPSEREIWRFLDVARRGGAIGASLYDLESGGATDLAALAAYPWTRR